MKNTKRKTDRNQKHKSLYVGLDIGSSAVHYAVLDEKGNIVYSPEPVMHFANTTGALKEAWDDISARFDINDIKGTAFTGSAAETYSNVIKDLKYFYDSVAIPTGAGLICPEAQFIFHIGAKDPYYFNVKEVSSGKIIQEWRTGTKCGGGSGTLIEKQCRRLFEGEVPPPELKEVNALAEPKDKEKAARDNRCKLQVRMEKMFRKSEDEAGMSNEPCEFLARCGVVIQSDLIHKQNEGTTRKDNLAGLFRTVARNYRIDVLGSREFNKEACRGRAIVTGGVFQNDLIRKNLEQFLGIEIKRPKYFKNVAAIGAAYKVIENSDKNGGSIFDITQIEKVAAYNREKRQFAQALSSSISQVFQQDGESLPETIESGTEVVIGIDGGSTTTKCAMVELKTGKLLDKLYIKTHGNPEGSLKRVIKYLSRHQQNVIVRGIGATGSARKLYEKILLSRKKIDEFAGSNITLVDKITDEITCHAAGVKHYDPDVDTIFEVGGQDMKFTSFASDGTVKEAKMNYSCQAGSGQTLENMADIINLDVESSLQEEAFKADKVPIIDSTCGVFMEMDENRLIAEGFTKPEIAAAIVRGTAASYYYKFVGSSGHKSIKCSAQGGPALGKAFLAALAQVSDKDIQAYPHREIFGAWGQALDIIENIKTLQNKGVKYDTAFRGWQLVDMPFEKEQISCTQLFKGKSCGVRDCRLEVFSIDNDKIITGGFCPRGNSEASVKPKKNYVEVYHRIYEKHVKKFGMLLDEIDLTNKDSQKTVGIKRSTATLGEKGIWSSALFSRLGFCPVVSPRTTKQIAQAGVDKSRTEFCIARKLATGHAEVLTLNPFVEYLFNPSFIQQKMPQKPDLKYCIYTESEGYVLNDVLSLDKNRQINPILHFGDDGLLIRAFRQEFDRLGLNFTNKQIRDAIRFASQAEKAFLGELYAEGDKFLSKIEAENTRAYVGIGRDYVVLDPEASSNSGVMLSQIRGLNYIPQVFLEHKYRSVSLNGIVENEFWVESVNILKAGLFVAEHPNLFAIRMMNFACGPDSLKIYQEEKIQQAANKPILVLLTDAQTNNAPFVTRTEAHERVVNQSKPQKPDLQKLKRKAGVNDEQNRIWLIPYMGNASFIGAAGLRHLGLKSQVLPTATQRGDIIARKHIHTEVCHPLKGVVGDAIGFLYEQIEQKGREYVENNYLVMLPTTSGPCRFGKYTELVREFLDKEGLGKIPVEGPSSVTDYFDIPLPGKIGFKEKIRIQQALYKGIKASDMLEDIFLRFNPYTKDKQQLAQLKQDRLDELIKVVERGAVTDEVINWGRQTVAAFQSTDLGESERFPLVLYIGEIYMRQHDPYTNNVVRLLEERGLEVVRDPVSDWLDYVNKMNQRNSRTNLTLALKDFNFNRIPKAAGAVTKSLLKGKYILEIGAKIEEPFHEVLAGRHVMPKPIDIINTLEKMHEFHGNIEGESPLSTGIAYHIMNDLIEPRGDAYIAGVFHVGPFTCMQEGVATAKIEAMAQELRKRNPELVFPVIHAFFGDSAGANLDSEIAVFVEQCYQKREILRQKYVHKRRPSKTAGGITIKSVPSQKHKTDNLSSVAGG